MTCKGHGHVELPLESAPWLTEFGLAPRNASSAAQTHLATVVLTKRLVRIVWGALAKRQSLRR